MTYSKKSNYEITKEAMEKKFLEYDQEAMICKFHLKQDERFLYIPFVGEEYRVDRRTGKTEYASEKEGCYVPGDFNASMTIFDVLCCSQKNCRLSGNFVSIGAVKGFSAASAPGEELFVREALAFAGKASRLKAACERLGGVPWKPGDVAFRLPLFEFMDVILQFWDADEEFDPVIRVLWDENILDFMHYETTFYATSHLLGRLKRLADDSR